METKVNALVANPETGEVIDSSLIVSPSQSPQEYIQSVKLFAEFMKAALKQQVHYGSIPRTKGVMLFQSGAEIIGKYFAIAGMPTLIAKVEDSVTGFFSYTYEMVGIHIPTQSKVGGAQGSCNSWETKYLYKWQGSSGNRTRVKRTPEELAADINTYIQMAQKRAYTAMIRRSTAASEFFQDEATEPPPGKPSNGRPLSAKEHPGRSNALKGIFALSKKLGYTNEAIKERAYESYNVKSMHELTMQQLNEIKISLQNREAEV